MYFEGFRAKVHSKVLRPQVSGRAVGPMTVPVEVISAPPEQLGYGEFQIIFDDGELDEQLWYLPYAFSHMHAMGEGYSYYLDMPLWFATSCAPELSKLGLYDDALDCIVQVLAKWISVFETLPETLLDAWGPERRFAYMAKGADARDKYLSCLLEYRLQRGAKLLIDELLLDWSADTSNPAASANLLDLSARALMAPKDHLLFEQELYGYHLVQSIAHDQDKLRNHLQACSGFWREKGVPCYYTQSIVRVLFGETP